MDSDLQLLPDLDSAKLILNFQLIPNLIMLWFPLLWNFDLAAACSF